MVFDFVVGNTFLCSEGSYTRECTQVPDMDGPMVRDAGKINL